MASSTQKCNDNSTVCSPKSLTEKDCFLARNTFIQGPSPTMVDLEIYNSIKCCDLDNYKNLTRWLQTMYYYDQNQLNWSYVVSSHNQPSSTGNLSSKKDSDEKKTTQNVVVKPKEEKKEKVNPPAPKKEEAEEFDLWDDTEEIVKPVVVQKPKPKKALIAKSIVTMDIKPRDMNVQLHILEEKVRAITKDGLIWNLDVDKVPVAYGIIKLRMACVVEDDKIDIDGLIEEIESIKIERINSSIKKEDDSSEEEDEDDNDPYYTKMVQSVDIVSFNKL